MPFKTIRLTCTALALLLALGWTCPNIPVLAAQTLQKSPWTSLIPRWRYPDKTDVELMQISLEVYNKVWLNRMIEAGQVITYGSLEVTSDPPGADILANSFLPLGQTPFAKHKLPSGAYRVTVRKHGYYEQVRMADVTDSQTSRLHFTLRSIPYARLTVKANPRGAQVSLMGVPEKYAPDMKLAPGDYLVLASHPWHGERRLWAVLKANKNLCLEADLTALPGNIKVSAKQAAGQRYTWTARRRAARR